MTSAVGDDDFQEILAATRDFVRTIVVPRESEISDGDHIPDDLRERAKKMGLFGYAIPQEWGGLGLDITQDVELALELGYTSLAVRSMNCSGVRAAWRSVVACWPGGGGVTRRPPSPQPPARPSLPRTASPA